MTHAEQEETLRRALHAAAESIEPAADGLDRIRARLSRPRPLVVAWLMAGWTGFAHPVMLRIEPAWVWLAELLGGWLRPVGSLWAATAMRLEPTVDRMRPALRRLRPTLPQPGGESASRTPRYPWLRFAAAVGVIVVIAFVGGFVLTGLPNQIISQVAKSILPSQGHHSGGGGGQAPNVTGSATPAPTSSSGQHRAIPSPSPSCSASPKAKPGAASPAPSPSTATTPSPTQSPSPSPPTSPSPTPAPSQSSTSGAISPTPSSVQVPAGLTVTDAYLTGGAGQGGKPSPKPTTSSCSPAAR